ncbi:MAG: hypothetical protein JXL85_02825 [Bacilli bacterium]|nr:hypothetical protein [Bacilli bacterium]
MVKMNNKGMALPFVLGIVTFLIGTVIVLMTMVIYQTKLIETDYEYREDYLNAQEMIEATIKVLTTNEDFSSQYITDLSNYMDVDISSFSGNTWMISRSISLDRIVTSYLSSLSESLSLVDEMFAYDGLEPGFQLDPLITPASMLDAHLAAFFAEEFPSTNYTGGFSTINEIFDYIDGLTSSGTTYISVNPTILTSQQNPTVNGHWFVDGNLTLSDNTDLVIPDGYILFVNGQLTTKKNSTIYGNVVVRDNVSISSKKTDGTINATIYTGGSLLGNDNLYLGTSNRPSFVFAEQDIILKKLVIGYGYFLSNRFQVDRRSTNINIIGGVYSPTLTNLESDEVQPYVSLPISDLYTWAVPTNIYVNQTSSGSAYVYTKPR